MINEENVETVKIEHEPVARQDERVTEDALDVAAEMRTQRGDVEEVVLAQTGPVTKTLTVSVTCTARYVDRVMARLIENINDAGKLIEGTEISIHE